MELPEKRAYISAIAARNNCIVTGLSFFFFTLSEDNKMKSAAEKLENRLLRNREAESHLS